MLLFSIMFLLAERDIYGDINLSKDSGRTSILLNDENTQHRITNAVIQNCAHVIFEKVMLE